MTPNVPTSNRWMKLCFPLVAAVMLIAPGCGHDHNSTTACTSCVSDSPTYHAYETPAPVVVTQPTYQPTYQPPAPVVSNYTMPPLRGPRSQAELDAIYGSSTINPLPPMPAPRPPQQQPPPCDNVVIVAPGESSWSVPMSREWKHIVIHHSASPTGNAASFDRAHRDKGWDGLGYHFVIGNGTGSGDGQVEVGYRWTKQMQGAHAGNYEFNQHGIGICLVGDFEHGGPPSPAQMQSLRTLVQFLQARSNIPPNEIIGHGNVPGRNTECPGRHLDMASFRASVATTYVQHSSAQVPLENPAKSHVVQAAASADQKPGLVKTVAKP